MRSGECLEVNTFKKRGEGKEESSRVVGERVFLDSVYAVLHQHNVIYGGLIKSGEDHSEVAVEESVQNCSEERL